MTQMQAFWAAVREQAAALPDEWYYVISVDDPARCVVGGSVAQVSRQKAAELLVSKTHRIATDEEVSAHLRHEEEQRQKYEEIEQRRLMHFTYAVLPKQQAPKSRAKTTE